MLSLNSNSITESPQSQTIQDFTSTWSSNSFDIIFPKNHSRTQHKMHSIRNRNLQTSKESLKSKNQGTNLFTSITTNQRGCPQGKFR